jgi:hypothetical protein
LTGVWVAHDVRDQIVDFVRRWSERTGIGAVRFIEWLGMGASKFYDWRDRYVFRFSLKWRPSVFR